MIIDSVATKVLCIAPHCVLYLIVYCTPYMYSQEFPLMCSIVCYVLCITTCYMLCVTTGVSPYVFHCMLCAMYNHMLYVMCNHRSFPFVFHSVCVLHCNCTSLSSVVASKHYNIFCILLCLPYVLCDVFAICTAQWSTIWSPHHALGVVRWQVLSYVCHTQVRPFCFTQM